MYKKLLSIILLSSAIALNAQETTADQATASVEKSVFSIQTGLVGIWGNNEFRLSNQFALRSEIGLELLAFKYVYSDEIFYGVAPVFSIEPKWYYNLEKRVRRGKNIQGNSGNSVSLKVNYLAPNAFLISNNDHYIGVDQINIIPKWSIRRVYSKHFMFETGIGVGPVIKVGRYAKNSRTGDIFLDIHARIGYCF